MNFSKKHKRHEKYMIDRYCCFNMFYADFSYLKRYNHFMRSKKSRLVKRKLRKDTISGAWQQRVYEQTGVRL